jgi:hypothetical protein
MTDDSQSSSEIPVTNRAIELHDSEVHGIEADGVSIVLSMTAYLHQSDGRPGFDRGTVWRLPARLVVENGKFDRPFTSPSLEISDGQISIRARVIDNLLPLPFDENGPIRLDFAGAEGELVIWGDRVYIEEAGPAAYLEEFPANRTT